jgi:hypothetical protein
VGRGGTGSRGGWRSEVETRGEWLQRDALGRALHSPGALIPPATMRNLATPLFSPPARDPLFLPWLLLSFTRTLSLLKAAAARHAHSPPLLSLFRRCCTRDFTSRLNVADARLEGSWRAGALRNFRIACNELCAPRTSLSLSLSLSLSARSFARFGGWGRR